ncbi:hypothetical protein J2X46_000494 [Nocardioides sp. BE266]|uniref:DUF222 domain-containing protein n=1 Tax=Nocardioides sp. BE266 TaxID=2817725 RepID=UPI002861786B|nr:DUF222 domain-containing protein [Nocardioides sp. BE266]MDR7251522.1 hypothetical protein [Nocardioides sp. BE266]
MTTDQLPAAAAIAALRGELRSILDSPGAVQQAELVDAIGELETLGRVVTAAQAELTARLDASLTREQEEAGARPEEIGRGVGHVVALARRESPHRGRRHLSLARIVPTELPHTWAAWKSGHIDEWGATVVARETACLPREHRAAVDEAVAGDADALAQLSPRQLMARLRSETEARDPGACVARRRKAESERHVTLRPAPDCMTWLTALLPVKDGVAAWAALTRTADTARAEGDPRTHGQVMADALVASVLAGPHERPSTPVSLGVVMTDAALFGGADDEAHLEDLGPIPAELAREIVCGAATAEEELSIRRLYASPTTGELVSMDARTRTFRGNLAKFVKLRDRTCRTPWCDAPVRHVDHVTGWQSSRSTSARGGQGLCEACNYAKTAHRWRARAAPDGSVTTTLPTGHQHTTRPPPIAMVRRRIVPVLQMDYVIAG